jgi:hypothetical protein
MPLLDVNDVLTDPDFVNTNLICTRNVQEVNDNGIASLTSCNITFTGVVTSVTGANLRRKADGELIYGDIMVITRFRLTDGKAGYTADIITFQQRTYTVVDVNNYSNYGRGFMEARCELIPFSG